MDTKRYLSDEIIEEAYAYWNEVFNVSEMIKSTFRKWTKAERIKKQRRLKKAHRGTNWNSKKEKKGYERVLNPTGTAYVYKRMSQAQKMTKKRVGQRLAKSASRFK